MSISDRFLEYAAAFEQTYEDDDWSRLEVFFTEDAVYEAGPDDAIGRNAVMAKLKGSIDGLDRQMDSRTPHFQAPEADGSTVTAAWKVTFTKTACPDLVISGIETASFEGDRITKLRDDFDPSAEAAIGQWMTTHGDKLTGS
jgi:hypothetical protein